MRVRWTKRALENLQEIGDYIAQDNPAAARRWVARLKARAHEIGPFPFAGRRVPEWDRQDIREVFLGSYRIVYQIYPTSIDVLAAFEGHRLFPKDVLPESRSGD